jgi:hypothetical protein
MKAIPEILAPVAAALLCCFGLSVLAAAGATTLLGLIGVALPAAILFAAASCSETHPWTPPVPSSSSTSASAG